MKRILIAGLGNIFFGDDAFGVEVAQALLRRAWPDGVEVVDFGIRSYDLAYALNENYELIILIDVTPRGGPAGTLYLLEPDLTEVSKLEPMPADGHSSNPLHSLQMAQDLGGIRGMVYLLGCEPADLGGEEGRMGLSESVQAAVPRAVEKIEALVRGFLSSETEMTPGLEPAVKE